MKKNKKFILGLLLIMVFAITTFFISNLDNTNKTITYNKSSINSKKLAASGGSYSCTTNYIITGEVLDENNLPVEGITVILKDGDIVVDSTVTNEFGYTFMYLDYYGTYNIEIESNDYDLIPSEEYSLQLNQYAYNETDGYCNHIYIYNTYVKSKAVDPIIEFKPFNLKVNNYIKSLKLNVNGKEQTYSYEDKEEVVETVKNAETISGEIEYKFVIKNTGDMLGHSKRLVVEIPSGLSFDESKNTGWSLDNGKLYYNDDFSLEKDVPVNVKLVLNIDKTKEIKSYKTKLTATAEPDILVINDEGVYEANSASILNISLQTGVNRVPYVLIITSVLLIIGLLSYIKTKKVK